MCLNSEEQARVAVRRFARIVQKLGFPVSLLNFRIHSIQAKGRAFPVSLERLVLAHRQHCRSGQPQSSDDSCASSRFVFSSNNRRTLRVQVLVQYRVTFFSLHSYEPELFNAVLYTVKPGVTVSIWSSGKFYISGNRAAPGFYKFWCSFSWG